MANNRLTPTSKTIKKLFALSGNICAFNDTDRNCSNIIINNSGTVLGEICHIHAVEENGARFNSDITNEELRSFNNLILLCPVCHKIIDDIDNRDKYNAVFLKKMKNEHEKRFFEKDISEKLKNKFESELSGNTVDLLKNIYETSVSTNKAVMQIQSKLSSSFQDSLVGSFQYVSNENFDVNLVKKLHFKILEKSDYPVYFRGVYREEKCWIGPRGCLEQDKIMDTSIPENIELELINLIKKWNNTDFSKLTLEQKAEIIAKFHLNFVKIHPFHDANGRTARVLLLKQIYDISRKIHDTPFTNETEYYIALKNSDNNDFSMLNMLVKNLLI